MQNGNICMQVNAAEQHLLWEAMGPALAQKAESLGMETNNLHEGLPQQPSQGYVDAKLYAARMRYDALRRHGLCTVLYSKRQQRSPVFSSSD